MTHERIREVLIVDEMVKSMMCQNVAEIENTVVTGTEKGAYLAKIIKVTAYQAKIIKVTTYLAKIIKVVFPINPPIRRTLVKAICFVNNILDVWSFTMI